MIIIFKFSIQYGIYNCYIFQNENSLLAWKSGENLK